MYEFLRGRVYSSLPGVVVIDAGGVGYRVLVSLSTWRRVPPPGGEAMLLLHHSLLSEQGLERLYGFATEDERELFRALLEVKGVGPATAIQVLCAAEPESLAALIAAGDVAALKRLKGIGPKTAERIVTELRERVSALAPAAARGNGASPRAGLADAIQALLALGYPAARSEVAVRKANESLGNGAGTEELVRKALQMV
jgi:holliday junction DNA helicase RuvA